MSEGKVPGLFEAIALGFDSSVVSRGARYFSQGRVQLRRFGPARVEAVVRGTRQYTVLVELAGEKLTTACSCPYSAGVRPCKHAWATLLAARRAGLLRLPETEAREEAEEEEAAGEPSGRPASGRFETLRPGGRFAPRLGTRHGAPADWRALMPHPPALPAGVASHAAAIAAGHGEILYTLDVPGSRRSGGLRLEVRYRLPARKGGWQLPRPFRIPVALIEALPDARDRQALAALAGARVVARYGFPYGQDSLEAALDVSGSLARTLAPLLCATGRLGRERNFQHPLAALRWDGETPWLFRLRLRPAPRSRGWRITGDLLRGAERMDLEKPDLLLPGGILLDEDRLSRFEDRGAGRWLRALRDSGEIAVARSEVEELLVALHELPELPLLELPEELRVEVAEGRPAPFLRIGRADLRRGGEARLPAELHFRYEGQSVVPEDPARCVRLPGARRLLRRDRRAEAAAAERLEGLGLLPVERSGGRGFEVPVRQLARTVRTLVSEDWTVEGEAGRFLNSGAVVIDVTSGLDWFDLRGGVEFGGVVVGFPELLAALGRGEGLVRLGDGRAGFLPEEWLRRYRPLLEAGAERDRALRFRRGQATLLDALVASAPGATADEGFERCRQELQRFEGIRPIAEPASFRGTLRDYQRLGLGWMKFLHDFGFGGCLADDMGLGKTVQVLALLEARRQERAEPPRPPSLVVAPKSVVFNWRREAEHFAPGLRLLEHAGPGRGKDAGAFAGQDLVLTTYGTLRRDIALLAAVPFDYLVLDESQAIKNARSESAKAARRLRAAHRLALSGTPIENHLGELWSLLDFLNPGMLVGTALGGLAASRGGLPDEASREVLARIVRPFLLRRTKEQVARELPPKVEQTLYCELEPAQRKLYEELRHHYRASLLDRIERTGLARSRIQILEALLRLRQAACHPALLDGSRRHAPSAKMEVLLPHLMELAGEGHKALVFSQFTSFLALVREALDREGVGYAYLDGRTRKREEAVDQFRRDPERAHFLISLKAGGFGLNLTDAEYVFLLDPWWNPAVEAQAIDRTHRIGQRKSVFAYRLIARDTVEERILELQSRKRALAAAILRAEGGLMREITRDDLELLLS